MKTLTVSIIVLAALSTVNANELQTGDPSAVGSASAETLTLAWSTMVTESADSGQCKAVVHVAGFRRLIQTLYIAEPLHGVPQESVCLIQHPIPANLTGSAMSRLSLLNLFFHTSVLLITQTALGGTFAVDVDESGVALKGHDPVAYFTEGRPAMGNAAYAASADEATYHFVSAESRDRFLADPTAFIPEYGGYCALGVTRSMKVTGDPEAWKIVDKRLYINSSPKSLVIWSEDIPGNIEKADEVWPLIKDKDPASL